MLAHQSMVLGWGSANDCPPGKLLSIYKGWLQVELVVKIINNHKESWLWGTVTELADLAGSAVEASHQFFPIGDESENLM